MKNKPLFITFEGGEGAGKTTLIEKLCDHLNASGHKYITTRQPGGTKIGAEIRQIVLHSKESNLSPKCELLLFLADRAQHLHEQIIPQLKSGITVICDRYNDSTIAYQGAARGMSIKELQPLCDFATDCLEPDITFYLDIDPEIGLERVQKIGDGTDRIESEKIDFHHAIRRGFLELASMKKRIVVIDASQSAEEVFNAVKEKLQCHLKA